MKFCFKITPLLLLVLLVGCERAPDVARAPILVNSEIVRLQPRQTSIRLSGEVEARVTSDLAFQVTGRVTERFVDVGAHVNAGDILAKIDPTEQLADVESAKAAVTSSEAQLRVAMANFERQKTLMTSGFTTRVSYDQAQQALNAAQGGLEASKAQLGTATDALGYTTLRASASGIITARNVEVGQVSQSSQSSYTLAEDGARDAVFDVYEAIFLQKLDGDSIQVSLVSNPKITARARPREISPTVDPKSGTVKVKMEILNVPKEMTLGSAVVGEGITRSTDKIILPSAAMTSSAAGPAVWVIDSKTHAVSLRDIVVESYETDSFVVSHGLTIGERIVISSGKMLRPGAIVTYAGIEL
ncbi:efflux RND transporter periplasmic adaptor subunit [Rhodopseudomonas boonkerdii]|uniref:efflux RND transporter periplasmic adaptor subunit n=1 Tax=Rhodopseudomonas boonkerdii TaxID=475937 RepID=UPI001E624B13|nr:efflux RND transporter periplasmic adaptor subunit [Rhodopseudomonas boonkerdii]UGV28242.1 efflux RND transporter periplasmic adaptor subunit [Rhodopseudomonas boonkerdii]